MTARRKTLDSERLPTCLVEATIDQGSTFRDTALCSTAPHVNLFSELYVSEPYLLYLPIRGILKLV